MAVTQVELDDTMAAARTQTLAPEAKAGPSEELPAGLRLGHFRIEKKLGAGGMGEVYLATDLALDRPVAIKVLPANTTSGSARDRLIREARAQARVHHPNVAHIYFIGEDTGRLYVAMELLEGKTLADQVATAPMSIDDALAAIRAAALGLREAHRTGFTHRDVKPSNLMSDAHGVVKVLDFGLVATADPTAGDADAPVAQTTMAGTPLYMAPEQARGEAIDLRADIYALGATLYYLISGRPPFVADSAAKLVSMHESANRPTLPRGGHARTAITALDGLIAHMMAPAAADRFASYDELLHAIELVSSQHTRPAGFWVRVAATGIDFIVATILTVIGILPFQRGDVGTSLPSIVFGIYAAIFIGWKGTTAGKALFELEVISQTTGKKPTWGQALLREALLIVPAVTLSLAATYIKLPYNALGLASAAWTFLIFVNLLVAAWRRPGKRAMWDRLSHTQVRYRPTRRPSDALLP